MASNAKDTLIRRISGTPGKGTGANTGLGTTDIVVPPFPLLPDRLTKETAAQFRDEVDRWRAGLQAQFPVPQTVATTTGSTGTVTGGTADSDSITRSELNDAIALLTTRLENLITQIQNNVTATAITPRTFQIFGKATSNAVVYDGNSNVEFNVRTLSVVPTDIALSTGSFIVGSVGEVGVDTQKSDIPLSGFGPAANDVSLGGYKISNLFAPSDPLDAANKAYVDSRPPVNIYNTNGTLTGNRTITGGGYSLSITGASSVNISSNTSTLLASPTVTFSTGGALNLYIASSTAAGTTSDFILGVNPADGQIRYTSATVSSLSGQGTSGVVSGTTGKIAKFTGTNSVGDSIMTQSASVAVVEVAGSMSVTDGYQINGQYIISWNQAYTNAVFGTRPSGWNTVTGYNNTGCGYRPIYSITSGQNNSGFGAYALSLNQSGNSNTAIGSAALQYQGNASDNTAVGALACISTTTASDNTAIGSHAMSQNTTGGGNFAGGSHSLNACATGVLNVAVGYHSGYLLTQGSYNTIIGSRALENISSASSNSNIVIGYYAGSNMTGGSGNIIIGTSAQVQDSTGSNQLSIGNLIFGTGLDAANGYISSGNIGIGVKVPTAKLEVDGAIKGLYQRYGSGSPEGLVAAPVGARYSRTDGGSGTSLYVKESGGTTTLGWVAMRTSDGISTANIYNSDGTLTANRTLSGSSSYSLTMSGLTSLSLSASGSVGVTSSSAATITGPVTNIVAATSSKITSPTITFDTGETLKPYFSTGTTTGTTSDYILVINSAGQIKRSSSTIAGISGGGGSGTVSGTVGRIAKFTSANVVGDSIMAETTSLITVTGSVAVTDGYKVNSDYVVSWNYSNDNAFFGTRPANWLAITGVGYRNTTCGSNAGYSLDQGCSDNVAVGYKSLYSTVALNQSGRGCNTAVGSQSLSHNTSGYSNSAFGYSSLDSLSSGNNNSAVGNGAISSASVANENAVLGASALAVDGGNATDAYQNPIPVNGNVAVGYMAGYNQHGGSANIIIGYKAQVPNSTGSYQLSIGNLIYGTGLDGTDSAISTGNIGIGVKIPTAKLDVDGGIKGLYLRYGSTIPENNVAAPVGAIYSRTYGGSGTSLYVKETGGTGSTGWVAVNTTPPAAPADELTAIVVDTLADLKNLDTTLHTNAVTLGHTVAYDGGGSSYRWTSDTNSSDNGFKILSNVSGAWINTSNVVNVRQWGALPSNTTNCGERINEAIEWAGSQTSPPSIVIPAGTYRLETPVIIRKSNINVDLFGTLKNNDTLPYNVLYIGNATGTSIGSSLVIPTVGPTISSGNVTAYAVNNVTIDGHGVGVIDQNCQTLASWESDPTWPGWISTNTRYGSYHAFYAYGVDGLLVRGVTVKNSVAWAMSIECCNNFDVSAVRSFSGFANGRLAKGVKQFLGTQDGIHSHDSKNGFIHDCVVESGDDALAVSAARTVDAGNVVVSGNRAMVKSWTYEADGVTPNTTSMSGRYGLSCFCLAQSYYCDLRNVTFANNVVKGGHGLFFVEDNDQSGNASHVGLPTNIKFIGNQFSGQNSSGTASTMQTGWGINGGSNIEFIGNTFNDIARIGRIGGASGKNGTIVFRGNKFSGFKRGYPYDMANWSYTPSVLRMTQGTRLVVEGNTFENNDIIPVAVGSDGDLTPSQFAEVVFNNNVCIGNNLRWTSGNLMPSGTFSAVLHVEAADNVEFSGNTIQNNNGSALLSKTCKTVVAKNNKILDLKGYTTSTSVQTADAFYVSNQPDTSGVIVDIQGNTVSNIDGQFFVSYNPGKMFIKNNTINSACNQYATGYLMTLLLNVSSISNPPITYFGGNIFGNSAYRSSGQSVMYFNTGVSTSGYTGNKLIYSPTLNQWGSNYTAADVQANATGIIATS